MNYLEQYQSYLQLRKVSPGTERIFCLMVKLLLDYEPDPKKITLKTISDLIKKRNGMGNTGAKTFITACSSFFDFLKRGGIVKQNPAENLKIKWGASQKKYIILSDEEMERLLEVSSKNLPEIEYLAIRLFIETGARRDEILNIKVENINLAENKIYLETTKGSKPRMVYISNISKDIINKYISGKKIQAGKLLPFYYQQLGSIVKKAIQISFPLDTGKHKLTPHALRHSFVTSFIANGGNTVALKHIIGWKSLEMLKTYEHLTDNTIQAEYLKVTQRRGL